MADSSSVFHYTQQGASRMRLCALAAVLAVLVLSGRANAFCPVGCFCDDETLQVTCDEANLEVIPITLNPSVQVIMLSHLIWFFGGVLLLLPLRSRVFILAGTCRCWTTTTTNIGYLDGRRARVRVNSLVCALYWALERSKQVNTGQTGGRGKNPSISGMVQCILVGESLLWTGPPYSSVSRTTELALRYVSFQHHRTRYGHLLGVKENDRDFLNKPCSLCSSVLLIVVRISLWSR